MFLNENYTLTKDTLGSSVVVVVVVLLTFLSQMMLLFSIFNVF